MSRFSHHIKSSAQNWEGIQVCKELESGVVHLWKVNLDPSKDELIDLWKILSSEEKEKANNFYFQRDLANFVKCRATLRRLLSNYLGMEPAEFQFGYTEYGKPYLSDFSLQFNVSHSNQKGLIAFTLEDKIGVDIEKVNNEIKVEKLANRFFSKNESSIILSLDEKVRPKSFFKCWTRKEAFIKAQGEGLRIPLDRFEMSILDADKVRLKSVDWKDEKVEDWSLVSFDVENDFIGALALKNELKELHFYQII